MTLEQIYKQIGAEGFSARALESINQFSNDIINGRTNFSRFTLPEHTGVCTGGAPLIGATVVAGYARAGLEAGADATGCQGGSPGNWQIDEVTDKPICIDCMPKVSTSGHSGTGQSQWNTLSVSLW